MELRDVEYFAVVAEHRHLGRAAEALRLSTPALSKSLRRLEKSLRAKLVVRTPKGVELTTEGSALLSRVRQLRLSLEDVAREVADVSQGRVGHLRIGVGAGSAEDLVALACSALLRDAPRTTMTVPIAQAPLAQDLRNGKLDLIVTTIAASPSEDIVQELLLEDEFVVFASVNHRLAKHPRVTMKDLAQERWALAAANVPAWNWLHRVFEDAGLSSPVVTVDTSSRSIRFQAVASSGLLGFTSRRALRQAAPRYHFVELTVKEAVWSRRVGVSHRKGAYLSPVARRFIEVLKSTAREIGNENW